MNKYVISVTKIPKKYASNWRWSKWGRYIGTQKRQAEYLQDEPNIQTVYTFKLHEII